MKCWKCNSSDIKVERIEKAAATYTPDLVIDGVERVTCNTCGEVVESWWQSESLDDLIRRTLVEKPRALSPGELKSLRKSAHPIAQDFAKMIGVTPEIVSKWENAKAPIPTPIDRLVRTLAALRWGLALDPLEVFPPIDDSDATPLAARFVRGKKGWTVATPTVTRKPPARKTRRNKAA